MQHHIKRYTEQTIIHHVILQRAHFPRQTFHSVAKKNLSLPLHHASQTRLPCNRPQLQSDMEGGGGASDARSLPGLVVKRCWPTIASLCNSTTRKHVHAAQCFNYCFKVRTLEFARSEISYHTTCAIAIETRSIQKHVGHQEGLHCQCGTTYVLGLLLIVENILELC